MSNKSIAHILQLVDALSVLAIAIVANLVIPGAEATGSIPQGATPAFVLGCAPLIYLAYVANQLFSAIGRGETFVSQNASRLKRMGVASAASAAIWLVLLALCALVLAHVRFSTYASLSVALIFTVALSVVCLVLAILTERAADIKNENDMTV